MPWVSCRSWVTTSQRMICFTIHFVTWRPTRRGFETATSPHCTSHSGCESDFLRSSVSYGRLLTAAAICVATQVPRELYNNLMLLHSYILVKYLIPLGDHKTAARMLLRVAKSATEQFEKFDSVLSCAVPACLYSWLWCATGLAAYVYCRYHTLPGSRCADSYINRCGVS